MVQLYMGDGKGKTCAAAGAALRAAGNGIPVIFGQFLKDSGSGEIQVLRRLSGLTLLHTPHHFGFFGRQTEEQKVVTKAESRELFHEAVRRCRTGRNAGSIRPARRSASCARRRWRPCRGRR